MSTDSLPEEPAAPNSGVGTTQYPPPPPAPPPPPYLGLVRPVNGRYIAGVCAGLARATNTDPVLWRILLPALTLLGGVGLLIYVVGWLLIPSEGDPVSPFESLIGRGRSSTAPWLAAVLTTVAVFAFVGMFGHSPGGGALLFAVAVGVLVLVLSGKRSGPPSASPPVPPAPRPTAARRIVFSLMLLAVGGLALLDLANVAVVPAGAYFALALAVLGVGMMVAAFFGRVRGPVTLGIVLLLGLAISGAADTADMRELDLRPASLSDLSDSYTCDTARLTLDLTQLNFSGADRTVDITVDVGSIRVLLPSDVDTTVSAKVDVGNAYAFGSRASGIDPDRITATDLGSDGAGGGSLHINANVDVGKIEVLR